MTSDVRLEFEPRANGSADQSEVLEAIAEALDGLAEQKGLGQDTVFRANLAVEELVLNAMVHGGASSAAPPRMDVAMALGPDGLTIEVGDNGPAFNPLEDAPPAPDIGPGQELSIGGTGNPPGEEHGGPDELPPGRRLEPDYDGPRHQEVGAPVPIAGYRRTERPHSGMQVAKGSPPTGMVS